MDRTISSEGDVTVDSIRLTQRHRGDMVLKCLLCLPIVAVVLPILSTVLAALAIGTSYWLVGSATLYNYANDTYIGGDVIDKTTLLSHTGLFEHCERSQDDMENTTTETAWRCVNVLQVIGVSELEGDVLSEQLKSVIAFEIISVVASCSAALSAIIGSLSAHPLAMLVSGVVGGMAGLFMLVGNSMYTIVHTNVQKKSEELMLENADEEWSFGWSLDLSWAAFVLCTFATLVQFTVYLAYQKYRKEHPDANMRLLCQYVNSLGCANRANTQDLSLKTHPSSSCSDTSKPVSILSKQV
ncbi:uncharacterized protein LOC144435889 [Glandiceps talaboti]